MNRKTKHTLIGFVATLIWSTAVFLFYRIATAFGPFLGGASDLFLAGLGLMGIAAAQGRFREIFSHPPKSYLWIGIPWISNLTLFSIAVGFTKTSGELVVVGLINYLWPILTILCSIIILRKRFTWGFPVAVISALIGIYFCKGSGFQDGVTPPVWSWNYLIILVAALSWGIYSVLVRQHADPEKFSPVPILAIVASAIHLVLYFLFGTPVAPGFNDFLILFAWASMSCIAYLSWDLGMRYGNVVAVSACAMLIPLLSTVVTVLATGERLTGEILLSAVLVVAGSYLAHRSVPEGPVGKES